MHKTCCVHPTKYFPSFRRWPCGEKVLCRWFRRRRDLSVLAVPFGRRERRGCAAGADARGGPPRPAARGDYTAERVIALVQSRDRAIHPGATDLDRPEQGLHLVL